MKKLELCQRGHDRWIWLVVSIIGKKRKITAQSGTGTDYATKAGARRAWEAFASNINMVGNP